MRFLNTYMVLKKNKNNMIKIMNKMKENGILDIG